MYDSRAVANHFLRLASESERPLDNMKLQKLIYFAHGWWWAEKGEPLLNEVIQAWQWGPVVQSIYHEFKGFGNQPITGRAKDDWAESVMRLPKDEQGREARDFLERVWKHYGKESASELSRKTHLPGTPWARVVKDCKGKVPMFKEIPDEYIAEYFQEAVAQGRSLP